MLGVALPEPSVEFLIVLLTQVATIGPRVIAEVKLPSPMLGFVRLRVMRCETAENRNVAGLKFQGDGTTSVHAVPRYLMIVAVLRCEASGTVIVWKNLRAAVIAARFINGDQDREERAWKLRPRN